MANKVIPEQIIEECLYCKYLHVSNFVWYCNRKNRKEIPTPVKLPDWCPLDNAPEPNDYKDKEIKIAQEILNKMFSDKPAYWNETCQLCINRALKEIQNER